ncbi:MqnA/MqnD/SBP family protein [Nitratifractor sp.]|uniref:MqnA/MqnD/SBP family protein n=1 Tax=Nitratifractor sp. TaxID=2268144 RepID=UPI0025D01337|nr:MqnA/MqnD/SBP family protein [Nitratifractor sp.]
MIFGSISYLNLLPFQVYMRRRSPSTQFAQMLRWRRAVPSVINRQFRRGRVHAAFISSIESRRCRCTDLGIVANGAVHSVFVLPGKFETDPASASSNALAEVLDLQGRILIGDAALKHRLSGGEGIDLAQAWKERTDLPFVFARLCYNRHGKRIRKLAKDFGSKEWKIPRYILEREAKKRQISPAQLRWYLNHIDYRIGWRERKGLKLFLKKAKKVT